MVHNEKKKQKKKQKKTRPNAAANTFSSGEMDLESLNDFVPDRNCNKNMKIKLQQVAPAFTTSSKACTSKNNHLSSHSRIHQVNMHSELTS